MRTAGGENVSKPVIKRNRMTPALEVALRWNLITEEFI
jgi:hypothetical protein